MNAPKELLRTLNVYVVGAITDSLEDEIIEIYGCEDSCPNPAQTAIICAVPYLRDKDILREGFEVEYLLKGLGEYKQIRQLFIKHAKVAAEHL